MCSWCGINKVYLVLSHKDTATFCMNMIGRYSQLVAKQLTNEPTIVNDFNQLMQTNTLKLHIWCKPNTEIQEKGSISLKCFVMLTKKSQICRST